MMTIVCGNCNRPQILEYGEAKLYRLGIWPHRCPCCEELQAPCAEPVVHEVKISLEGVASTEKNIPQNRRWTNVRFHTKRITR